MKPLTKLVEALAPLGVQAENIPAELSIAGITSDSRQVKKGDIFVALSGVKHRGSAFIPQATAAGAALIVMEREDAIAAPNVPIAYVSNARAAYALLASAWFISQPEYMVAVTGTDGKTSTAEFFRQLMELSGVQAASLGTIGVKGARGVSIEGTLHTTPDPMALHQTLSELAANHYRAACVEASSHGLHQHRLDGVRFTAGAFTNLTRDHLDYHGTMEAYFAAKARLFSEVLPTGAGAVIYRDDAKAEALLEICTARGLRPATYGRHEAADFRIISQTPHANGQHIALQLSGQVLTLDIPLVGEFQVLNMLAALGLAQACGQEAVALAHLLPKLAGVPGRLEWVATTAQGAQIYVDYAHTPGALAKALEVLRPHTAHRLHVLFGCGGERDAGKRPLMGQMACKLADVVTVTDDNPRSEDPALIRREIMAGCVHAKEVAGREAAIYAAVQALGAGDVLLLAGKGHEQVQILAQGSVPFSDADVARQAVRT